MMASIPDLNLEHVFNIIICDVRLLDYWACVPQHKFQTTLKYGVCSVASRRPETRPMHLPANLPKLFAAQVGLSQNY